MVPDPADTLPTEDGVALEARLHMPVSVRGGVVVCHPHPLYGGDMENPVVVRVTEVCSALGLATLRFNFRGVGRSAGVHGDGLTEELDVEAGLARLATGIGAPSRLAPARHSFGATVGAQGASPPPGPAGGALIAPPLAPGGPEHLA